ncbi:MAG: hypothetical protein ACQEW8_07215 [Actinomycetota bacterium]
MTEGVKIPVATMRRVAEVLLQHVEQLEGDVVEIENDYFWSVPAETQYDMTQEPRALTIGQLSESLEHVQAFEADSSSVISYGLVWLGDIMRAVGQRVIA